MLHRGALCFVLTLCYLLWLTLWLVLFSLQRLCLVKGYEVIGQFLKIHVHYLGKPVEGKPYPVVRDPVLGKIIGAYLLRPVAGAYLHLPLGRYLLLLFPRFFVEKAGEEYLHGLL